MTLQDYFKNVGGNYSDIFERLASDDRIFRFLNKFFDADDINLLESAWNEQDGEKIFQYSHRMKGGAINIDLKNLYSYASELTEAYRNGNIPKKEDTFPVYKNLCSEYCRAKQMVAQLN